MYQGTTPTIPFKFKGVDLTSAKVYLTFEDKKTKAVTTFVSGTDFSLTLDGDDTVGFLSLTQEQTLAMTSGEHTVQGRYIFPNGAAGATKKKTLFVSAVILKDVISYD